MFEDQLSGQLIPPNNPEKLVRASEKYIVDPDFAESGTIGGSDNIKEQFNFDKWPANWLELFFVCIDGTLPSKSDAGADE